MKYLLSSLIVLFCILTATSQQVFQTYTRELKTTINGTNSILVIDPEQQKRTIEVECILPNNIFTLSDEINSIDFQLKAGDKLNFYIKIGQLSPISIELIGIESNVHFTDEYINQYKGKHTVEIPQVSELINIILSLHQDAEKDHNMFDTQSEYYKKVKKHFSKYRNHPAIDTIQKYLGKAKWNDSLKRYLFDMKSYQYYYSLKMNACGYEFDEKGHIKNQGFIKKISNHWTDFDPMKDVAIFEDFAKKSNFKKFFRKNKNYYNQVLADFEKLNPIKNIKKWLDEKFNFSYDSYRIFFSPLNKGAQSTISFEQENFSQTFMFISKPIVYQEHTLSLNELLSSWIVFTEIDHNYVNPVSDFFIDPINKSFSNRQIWAKGPGTEAYPDPYSVFNEYMTFALFTLYAIDHYSEDDVLKFLSMYEPMVENTRGFIRFKDFNRTLLEKYKQDRTITPAYLYAHIIKWANKINKE